MADIKFDPGSPHEATVCASDGKLNPIGTPLLKKTLKVGESAMVMSATKVCFTLSSFLYLSVCYIMLMIGHFQGNWCGRRYSL
jgi:hypothetical protein